MLKPMIDIPIASPQCPPEALHGGGFALDQSQPMQPLREEWGGDGRTPDEPVQPAPNMTTAKTAADKLKAQLRIIEPPKRRREGDRPHP
jgi:hypothetical protein